MLINGATSQWNSCTYIVVWRRTRSKCFNHSAFGTKGNDGGRSKTLRQKKRDSILAFSDECSSLLSKINSDISAGILIRLFVFIFSFFRIGKGLGVSLLSSTVNSDISAGILIQLLFVFIFSFFRIGKGLGVSMKGRLPSEFDDRNAHEEGRFLLGDFYCLEVYYVEPCYGDYMFLNRFFVFAFIVASIVIASCRRSFLLLDYKGLSSFNKR